jgi:signal transduction histidine kinase
VWHIDESRRISLAPAQVTQVMRILNEALANALKHSGSSRYSVTGYEDLSTQPASYALCLQDFGVGIQQSPALSSDQKQKRRGNGLNNMHKRAQLLGATLVIEDAELGTGDHDHKGTNVTLRLPLTSSAAPN